MGLFNKLIILYQVKGSNLPLYLILLGTDPLELLFCLVRTLTHAKNCDMIELMDRLTICSQIEETFQRNENLRPKSRLNTTSFTLDHSSIRDWCGNFSRRFY